jgi:hypothetical protein
VLSSAPPKKTPGHYAKLDQDHLLLQADHLHINEFSCAPKEALGKTVLNETVKTQTWRNNNGTCTHF